MVVSGLQFPDLSPYLESLLRPDRAAAETETEASWSELLLAEASWHLRPKPDEAVVATTASFDEART